MSEGSVLRDGVELMKISNVVWEQNRRVRFVSRRPGSTRKLQADPEIISYFEFTIAEVSDEFEKARPGLDELIDLVIDVHGLKFFGVSIELPEGLRLKDELLLRRVKAVGIEYKN